MTTEADAMTTVLSQDTGYQGPLMEAAAAITLVAEVRVAVPVAQLRGVQMAEVHTFPRRSQCRVIQILAFT